MATACGDLFEIGFQLHGLYLHDLLLTIDGFECVLSRFFIQCECTVETCVESIVDTDPIVWFWPKRDFFEYLCQCKGKGSLYTISTC